MRLRFLLSFFSLIILLSGNTAHAISVGPAIIETSVEAGSISDFSFVVTNEENTTLSYALTIQKFIPLGEEGRTTFLPPTDTSGLPEWMFLEAPTLTLRPGESKRVAVSLRVPNEAAPGGHYAAIFLTQTNLDTSVGQNVAAIPRIGILVLATIKGNLNERLVLQQADVDHDIYSSLPVRFRMSVENQGNTHVQPKVQITVSNMFGNIVAKVDGNADAGRVLPGSRRTFVADWAKESGESTSGFWNSVVQEVKNFGIGPYEARITVSSPNITNAGEAIVRFQVWPWRLGVLTIVGLAGLFIVWKGLKRFVIKRATR
jgi:hypothetical protein